MPRQVPDRLAPGAAARLLGVCAETLRNWEIKGLLKSYRTMGGHRRYRTADLLKILRDDLGDAAAEARTSKLMTWVD